MSTYLEIPIPPSSDHLWRYTPWKRVHPSAVNTIPESQPLAINGCDLQDSQLPDSDEIARSFIHSMAKCRELILKDDDLIIDVKASGHVAVGELKIIAKGHNTLVINLMGEASWAGLRIMGEVSSGSSLSISLINELSNDSRLLRVEDWVVGRDANLEFATLSAGGEYCKCDIRVELTEKGSECYGSVAIHGTGKRHDDHHFEVTHASGHTTSGLVIHAACDDNLSDGVDYTNCQFSDEQNLTGSYLPNSNLSFTGFIKVNFDKSIMMNSILSFGNFPESSFIRATWCS